MNTRSTATLLSLVLSTTMFAAAAASPDGFLDIPWGSSSEEVKQQLIGKTGTRHGRNEADTVIYHGGTFAGRNVNAFKVWFTGGRLFRGDVFFPAGTGRSAIDALKKDLTAKYGPPKASGKVIRWAFPVSPSHKEPESIELSEHKDNQIRLSYFSETLRASAPAGSKDDL